MFNTLKKEYRRRNLYTMGQVTDSMAYVSDDITIICTNDEDNSERLVFYDYVAFLDSIYPEKIDSPWCSTGHIFTVSSDDPGKLKIMVDDLGTKSFTQDMIRNKRKHDAIDRKRLLRDSFLSMKPLDPVGLSNIKQIEMGTKYRPLIPEKYRNYPLYAIPSEATMQKEKIRKSQKKASKLELKTKQEAVDCKLKDV